MLVDVEAVIFDLDDTLYSERQYAFSGFAAVAAAFEAELGPPGGSAPLMRRLFDTPDRSRVFNAMLIQAGHRPPSPGRAAVRRADQVLIGRMVEVYRTHTPTIKLYPDADATLTRLRRAVRLRRAARLRPRFKLGLISDGLLVTQQAKISALGLRSRLDAIVLTAGLGDGFGKPHPKAFELMAQRLGADACRCAYVADNPSKDFVAPNALGWRTIQIKRADGIYREQTPARDGTPQHLIDTLDRLEALIDQS